ncbi:MAG: bifunctional DNA-formamidopyrimidine glycosylase/DNA-(apurinic or apyrimidinic site) lyase [Thermodesulfobacteriota bacterium]|nr:bifunctional DNA-formamidopyrimidine glycosylase/DNA-(apurinic or apyrimidinic site) lyase [Thermodesulfobacteriota bacterium]
MPELPEVETIVRDLQALVVGRRIEAVRVRRNKIARTGPGRLARLLADRTVLAAKRRGKIIVLTLSGEYYLVVHLKMTGQFLWGDFPRTWPKHVHLILDFGDGQALLYRDIRRFGYLLGLTAGEYAHWLVREDIGPDPFQISPHEFTGLLCSRKGRIKPLLLNQKFISGLGNIYVDEALFAAGIHPLCPAKCIDGDLAERLHQEIIGIMKEAIRLRGSTTNNYVGLRGAGGEFQAKHRVYGRTGSDCLVCGQGLKRIVVAGRGTHFCPACQPEA